MMTAKFDVAVFKGKSISITGNRGDPTPRSRTPDMIAQGHMLNDVADLIDKGGCAPDRQDLRLPLTPPTLKRGACAIGDRHFRGKSCWRDGRPQPTKPV